MLYDGTCGSQLRYPTLKSAPLLTTLRMNTPGYSRQRAHLRSVTGGRQIAAHWWVMALALPMSLRFATNYDPTQNTRLKAAMVQIKPRFKGSIHLRPQRTRQRGGGRFRLFSKPA